MQISTNTASCMTYDGFTTLVEDVEAMKILRAAGFRALDLSFVFQRRPEFILRRPDWEQQIERLGLAAEEAGVTFNQCHFPYTLMHLSSFHEDGYDELFFELTRRAYHAAAMLKIPHGVLHPQTFPHLNHENKACREENRRIFDPYVELGIRLGVRSAFENMPPMLDHSYPMRYCLHYDQLIELVDSYQEPEYVGICWDTGHANLAKFDQPRALHAIGGKRLIALHLNDNHGGPLDEHILPYLGTNKWQDILQALVDIDYRGDLTYEVGAVSKFAPQGYMQDALIRATYENALGLSRMYDQLREASRKESSIQ